MTTELLASADALRLTRVVCGCCLTTNRLVDGRLHESPICSNCGARLLDGKPVALDERSFDGFVGHGDLPVVVDFWAPWCAPCCTMAPILDAVASVCETSVRFAKVNVDVAPALAQRYAIMSIPTLVLFHQGIEKQRITGVMSRPQLQGWLAASL